MDSAKDSIAAGQYASVVGSLRSSPMVHVSAMSLRPVAGADEVAHLSLEWFFLVRGDAQVERNIFLMAQYFSWEQDVILLAMIKFRASRP